MSDYMYISCLSLQPWRCFDEHVCCFSLVCGIISGTTCSNCGSVFNYRCCDTLCISVSIDGYVFP